MFIYDFKSALNLFLASLMILASSKRFREWKINIMNADERLEVKSAKN